MLLDDSGLNIKKFDAVFAAMIGADSAEIGAQLIAEATMHTRGTVQLRDWLYCLAKSPNSVVFKRLIEALGQRPEAFVNLIEEGIEDDDAQEQLTCLPPTELTSTITSKSVLTMLEKAEGYAQGGLINDAMVSLAIFESMDESLHDMLEAWCTAEGINKFKTFLRTHLVTEKVEIFDRTEGQLKLRFFDASGLRFINRLIENVSSFGAPKVTTRHILHTLLDNPTSILRIALETRGIDVKRDLHATLTRELVRSRKKRCNHSILTQDIVFETFTVIVQQALKHAKGRGTDKISDYDMCCAFVEKQAQELARLFPASDALDLTCVLDYMETSEPEDDISDRMMHYSVQEIETALKQSIFGQNGAIERVIPWVKRMRFGFPRDGRPAGVFLFLGPTGAGKTQLAKELAHYIYGDEDKLIFLEMGQFQTKQSMSGFIGAPPGYVGYGEGILTNGLRDQPEAVVLFDEIEKAHTQVFDALLRFADEGMISDPAGPIRDGRQSIIIMTTNAGQTWLREHIKIMQDARENPAQLSQDLFEAAMQELKELGFRPEFLGRIDERVTFLPFDIAACREIVNSVLDKELDKFKKLKNIDINVSAEVREVMANKTCQRTIDEGARSAPRVVNELIVTPAIDMLMNYEDDFPTLIVSLRGLQDVVIEIQ